MITFPTVGIHTIDIHEKQTSGNNLEREGNFLLSPASAAGEVHNSSFDWTVSSVTRNDFLVSSEPHVGILI